MKWIEDDRGVYCDLYDNGYQVGWVYNETDRNADKVAPAVGTGDYYGYGGGTYARAETIDELKALVVTLYRMGG